jgi:hypothetical protein
MRTRVCTRVCAIICAWLKTHEPDFMHASINRAALNFPIADQGKNKKQRRIVDKHCLYDANVPTKINNRCCALLCFTSQSISG